GLTMIRVIRYGALAIALFGMGIGQARAQFSESFDAGSATYTTNDPYWLDQVRANGYIIKTTSSVVLFPGFFATIPQDAGGSGFFLFTGTAAYSNTSFNIPPGQDQFYISPAF